ncbi:RnfABCDGE type electron transport complex subunit D [Laribacter hongkongensis]|uniref:RnfABCDGE type electron transport complex subunit D n=1 Tax=Laribacter hongkongensis TaxID=168471 RepID=UPI001EFD9DA8|nr:RnfABCDGE type electron transport complex subunit D [Laribacter hongkongensis]MCG9078721.1 RnfABCDGE type electron transport complex subunit D [Laribacter hongkongensis]
MKKLPTRLYLHSSPHLVTGHDTPKIMRHVVYALLPVTLWAIWQFGTSAFLLVLTVVLSCVLTERLILRHPAAPRDMSAVITGLTLALTLPPALPLWMGAVAGIVAIALGKLLFGGLGSNVFNPALVGRAFVQASFPAAMTTWTPAGAAGRFTELIPSTLALPFTSPDPVAAWAAARLDGFAGATPLAAWKFAGELPIQGHFLLSPGVSGSLGETSALLIVACGLYLAVRGMLNWRIPLAVLLGAALVSTAFGPFPDIGNGVLFVLTSGGLMFGAWFMATDMVTAPITRRGMWVYGLLIGALIVTIRFWGGASEGVMYAILLANALVPHIEALTQPRHYGRKPLWRRS